MAQSSGDENEGRGGAERSVAFDCPTLRSTCWRRVRPLRDRSDLLFPWVSRPGKPLNDITWTRLLREQGVDAVPHGFRSSFRDWCAYRPRADRFSNRQRQSCYGRVECEWSAPHATHLPRSVRSRIAPRRCGAVGVASVVHHRSGRAGPRAGDRFRPGPSAVPARTPAGADQQRGPGGFGASAGRCQLPSRARGLRDRGGAN